MRKKIKKTKKVILPVRINPVKKDNAYEKLSNEAELTEEKTEINTGDKIAQTEKKSGQAPTSTNEIDNAKIEREKKLIMHTGIAFFMILITSVWIFNIKNVFESAKTNTGDNTAQLQLNEITDEFSKNMKQIKQGLEEIKSLEKNASSQNEAAQESGGEKINPDEIEKLKEKLEELDNGAVMDKEQASSADNTQNNQ